MTWAVSAEVERFDDAADWFLKRTVITAPTAVEMTSRIAQDSFWVGAGLQLSQVQRVFDKIGKAVEKGELFADWRAKVRKELQDDAHAETVFRNATQRSYNAGRWIQMREPDVFRFRPFWMFDAILDGRTTAVCQVCNKVILPGDDAWWNDHIPPLHHKCRSSIRNMRRSEAEKLGVLKTGPDTSEKRPPGDWGKPPTLPGWKPDLKKVDPVLAKEVTKKAVKREAAPVPPPVPRSKKPKPKTAPVEHSYEHWVDHYTPKYGLAAKSVGWGRMAQERGLDMPLGELERVIDRLAGTSMGQSYKTLFHQVTRGLVQSKKTLRQTVKDLTPEAKALAGMAGHIASIETRTTPLRFGGQYRQAEGDDVALFESSLRAFDVIYGARINHPTEYYSVTFDDQRSFADIDNRYIFVPHAKAPNAVQVITHEWAHPIEHANGDLVERAAAFRDHRARSQELVQLKKLDPGRNFQDEEVAREDEFLHPYVGKVYTSDATEVTSMSIDRWSGGEKAKRAMAKDSDHMYFGLGQMSGHDLQEGPRESKIRP